jgi:hypothetical protein
MTQCRRVSSGWDAQELSFCTLDERSFAMRGGLCSSANETAVGVQGIGVMATEETLLRGSCLCGMVAYEVSNSFEYSFYCHCSNCRRATGAAAKPFAGIKSDRLAIVSGGDHVMRYGGGTNHDAHCERCGSLLYSMVRNGAYFHVTLGTLIDSPSIRPTAHIFVGSKATWDNICDGLPQFDGFP